MTNRASWKEKLQSALGTAAGIVFPSISTNRANRKVLGQIEALEAIKDGKVDFRDYHSFAYLGDICDKGVLKRKYEESLDHKRQLEDKAKSLVALTTISATIMFGLGSAAPSVFEMVGQPAMRVILAAVMIFSAFYMVVAAFSAICVFASLNKAYLINDTDHEDEDGFRVCVMQNEYQNIRRNNFLYLSFGCMKRSLGSLLIIFVAMVVAA